MPEQNPSEQKSGQTTAPPPETANPSGASAPPSAPPPLRCFTGAFVAGSLGVLMYRMTLAIATTFAN
ncbi:MAG: DUF3082 domain-containing protein, partial [Cyanobacteria bacterium P01_A01_bin.105]